MDEEVAVQCSAKGCRSAASWALRWNNPKLHEPAYRKTWLACDQHREHLSDFLGARGFLREVTAFPATA
ncbi:hypothetical protein [Symbioplanes lichenis]|uniref:hypothetical protein n=1 Tax=Symbioplanes lichenis TaxID=1629072 RepID=UPI00273988DA|nr:hypothetical protein [Actinoplanes lichenis]